jgi:adenylate cyclase
MALSAAGAWKAAAALYGGDLLDGVALPDAGFADWLLVERARLHDTAVRVLTHLLESQSGDAALVTAERLLRLDPTHEEAHRALMRLHLSRGDRARALRQFQLCRDVLWRDLSVRPEPETERLFNEIKSATSAAPAPRLSAAEGTVSPAAGPEVKRPPSPRWRRWVAAAAVLAVVGAAGALAARHPWDWPSRPRDETPLAEKPSVAVLPFDNLSDDPRQSYFADGIAQDLMTDLSRIPRLFVVARNSTFAYRGKAIDVRDIARELGARYVVEGSVRRAGDQLRINVQVIDAENGRQTWAQRYDGAASEIFALQDRVTAAVADALALQLTVAEQHNLVQHETTVPAAYDAFLRGWDFYQRATPDNLALAIPHFEQAIEADPAYGRAYAALATIYFQGYDQHWAGILRMSANDAYRQALHYLKLAQQYPTSTSHQIAGNVARDHGWYDDALKEFEAAILLEPGDPRSYADAAYSLIWANRPIEAETQIRIAMRLDPHYPPLFSFYLGLVQFEQGRLEEAAATLETVVQLSADDSEPALFLTAVYGKRGMIPQAQKALGIADAIRIRQGGIPFTLNELFWHEKFRARPLSSPVIALLVEGLRLAGTPTWFESGGFEAQQLKAQEIDALIFGHRIHGRSLGTGEEHGASVFADGTAIMFGDWGAGSGTARLEGNGLCFEWTTGDTNCGAFYRNLGGTRARENEYIWFSHRAGGFSFSQAE